MIFYDKEKIKIWRNLEVHLEKLSKGYAIGNKNSFPEKNFLVAFLAPEGYEKSYKFKTGETVLFLGEIYGMKGHGIFATHDGKIQWGFHTDNFYIIPKDEL